MNEIFRYEPRRASEYLDKIRSGEPVSFSRYCDGEWLCIMGERGKNCDGHVYYPEMGRMLLNSLISPRSGIVYTTYDWEKALVGYRGSGYGIMGMDVLAQRVLDFMGKHSIDLVWENSLAFYSMNINGDFYPVIKMLRESSVMVVGASHLRVLDPNVFACVAFVEIPLRNCFLEMDRIREEILAAVEKHSPQIIIFCASMMTEVLIYDLYPLIGDRVSMLDMGSLFDAYVGVITRPVYGTPEFKKKMRGNLGIKEPYT